MKHAPQIAAALMGVVFIVFGSNFFLKFIALPPFPEGSPPALFFGALYGTGYLAFIKVLEIIGGILVAVPKTRNIGLLVLGPIVVNILAFHVFQTQGVGLFTPPVLLVSVLSAYLVWNGRKSFAALLG
jgi:hypothetical protein